MRVDRRRYVRDLALAAPLFGARGWNSAAYAQGLNALADVKNPNFCLGSVVARAVADSMGGGVSAAAHLWCGSKSIITASNKQSTHGRNQWRRRHTVTTSISTRA